jgi:uncharacterized protein
MFLDFFYFLRTNKFPVSLTEHLTLLEALDKNCVEYSTEEFYYLSKMCFVKHESMLDRYAKLFKQYFEDLDMIGSELLTKVPEDWLNKALQREFTDEEKKLIEAMGGLDKLLERLKQLLEEQKERHQGGNRWIGTNGTSPYGNSGYNPEGVRMGGSGGGRSAVKVWDTREYENYDDEQELNTRNMKMAMRRLRILTREGVEDELDLDETIEETSKNAGLLDIVMRPTRKNKVKVLLLLDVGGSMDDHIELCNQLFSAAKYQFKHLEHLYFHNCVYETLWKDNARRSDRVGTYEVLRKYNKDWKIIFVGDASMAPYELTAKHGSAEHYNEESGMNWLERFSEHYPNMVWLNPNPASYWKYTQTTRMIRDWSDNRMFPLTISGLTKAMKCLKNDKVKYEDHLE